MKRLTLILAGLALVTTARAADTTDFKWDAEMRARYTNDQAFGFNKNIGTDNYNNFQQRNRLGVTGTKGENFSGRLVLSNSFFWGGRQDKSTAAQGLYGYRNPDSVAGSNNAADTGAMVVQEAWGWWKANDMLSIKFGRAPMTIAGGAVSGANDWFQFQTVFDGVWTMWDFEPVKLNIFGLKLYDDNTSGAAGAITGTGAADIEQTLYGLVLGVKTLPEAIKTAEVHFLMQGDEVTNSTSNVAYKRTDIMRYGVNLNGDIMNIDYSLIGDFYTGKNKGGTGTTDQDVNASMIDVGAGYTMHEFMNTRFGLQYHTDTGDSVTASTDKVYHPFAWEMHDKAGIMDVINWGNLTYFDISLDIAPMEDMAFGLDYIQFTRTSEKASASTNNGSTATNASNSTALGNEIDVTATKKYGSNFKMDLLYGVFTPGDAFKQTLASQSDAETKVQVQGTLTF